MRDYIARRLLWMIPTLFGITLVTFVLSRMAPGGPIAVRIAQEREGLTHEEIERTERLLGLDRPVLEQYGQWLGRVVQLDFGVSFALDRRPVRDKILDALQVSFVLQLLAVTLIYLLAVPLGVYSAVRDGDWLERLVTLGLLLLYSIPSFLMASLLLLVFSMGHPWDFLPLHGLQSFDAAELSGWDRWWDWVWHLILPVACTTYAGTAALSRYARAGMVEALRSDYVRTARAKGLPERRVIFHHALRNGLIPLVTLFAYLFPALLGGSVIIEAIFGIPGMGRLAFESVLNHDYPTVMGLSTLVGVMTLVGFLVSDILYAVLDPRIVLR